VYQLFLQIKKMTRSVLGLMWENFLKSTRRPPPILPVGKDNLGNKYFESKKDEASGRRYKRWYEPFNKEKFDQEVPVEWEAWLRYRRNVPPTEEEIHKNESMKMSIQEKVKALQVKRQPDEGVPSTKLQSSEGISFPDRAGYQKVPGEGHIREPEKRPHSEIKDK